MVRYRKNILPQSEEEKRKLEEFYVGVRDNIDIFAEAFCKDLLLDDIPEFHHEIYGMANESRVVLAAPRGFAKSSVMSKIVPMHKALFKLRNDIMIVSNSEGLAVEHLRYIKMTVESSPLIRKYFGDLKSEKWTENHIIIQHKDKTRINIRAKGAGGQIRGFRPDLIIGDDLETDETVASEEQRKKLKDWLFRACINCLLPGGQIFIIGTILSQLSLMQDLLEMDNGWVKRKYKAYKDGVQKEGHELWPSARPHEWLQKRKAEIGSHRFASEYMNDPRSDEHAVINDKQIKYWKELPQQLGLVIAVDPAYSEDSKADFKVAVLVGIDQNYNRYLINYVRTHAPTGEFMDGILNMWLANKTSITGVGVPNSGTEKQFYDSLLKKAEERNLYPPFTSLKNSFNGVRNKKDRVMAALQPLFEQGKYYINADHVEAREELLEIGNSRWDDIVDAMSYAEQILTPVYHEINEEHNREEQLVTSNGGYGIDY